MQITAERVGRKWRPIWFDATSRHDRYPYLQPTRKKALALARLFADQELHNREMAE